MDKLKTRIHFRSGKTLDLTSEGYYKGQFKEWCLRNFVVSNNGLYQSVVMGDLFILIGQVEYVEEIE